MRADKDDKIHSDDMIAMLEKDKQMLADTKRGNPRSNLYKAEADEHKSQMLSKSIGELTEVLKRDQLKHISKVDFDDLEEVKKRTIEYFESCQATGHYPSMLTLCSIGYGCSRQLLDIYINKEQANTMKNISYIRILGFNTKGKNYLNKITLIERTKELLCCSP